MQPLSGISDSTEIPSFRVRLKTNSSNFLSNRNGLFLEQEYFSFFQFLRDQSTASTFQRKAQSKHFVKIHECPLKFLLSFRGCCLSVDCPHRRYREIFTAGASERRTFALNTKRLWRLFKCSVWSHSFLAREVTPLSLQINEEDKIILVLTGIELEIESSSCDCN